MATVAERPPAASEQARAAERRRRRRRSARRRQLVALAFLSPWIVGFSLFYVYPMVASLYFSFTQYDILSDPVWVGLDNYRFMFTGDAQFWPAMRNTIWIIVFLVPLQVVFAIGAATVLTRVRRGLSVYRTIFFLPTMVPLVAAAVAWVVPAQPGRAGQPHPGLPAPARAAVVLRPGLDQAGAAAARPVDASGRR